MTIIEQIKAEIKRRMEELDEQIVDIYDSKAVLRKDELQKLLSFLDTLEEPACDELEEELDRFIASGKSVTVDDYGTYKVSYHDFKKVASHFAEWQKEKMMKGAVKGTIYGNGGYTWVVGNIPSQFKYGDKVKIIFVKEDEK